MSCLWPLTQAPVLDPRISYEGMKADYDNNHTLAAHLKTSKYELGVYFQTHYANKHTAWKSSRPLPLSRTTLSSSLSQSPQKNFTACFQRKTPAMLDELEEYFKLPQEDFNACHPIQWWFARRSQFPNLFCLARDIFSIPGMFDCTSQSHCMII